MDEGLAALAPATGAEQRETLKAMSGGSLGRALELLERDGLALAARMGTPEKPVRMDFVAQHALADELAKAANEANFDLFLSLAEEFLMRSAHEFAVTGGEGLGRANRGAEALARIKRLVRLEDRLHLDHKYVALNVLGELAALSGPAAKAG